MFVRNIAGYPIKLKYRESYIQIPYDGRIYSIPDDMNTYGHCQVIMPFNIKTQDVTYINKTGDVSEIEGRKKRRGRKPKPPRDPNKPLKGVSISKKKRKELKKKLKTKAE